ncbi:MAG TPA: recombinase family protein [Spirochaetia bacterium]
MNTRFRAAAYVRMSTDHQELSIQIQLDEIQAYAKARKFEVVRVFSDEGRSGVSFKGRPALQEMIRVVQSEEADFETILCYDVSRWGRFQDPDESAHYEFLCKSNGISLRFCAEQFENDGSISATIIKNVKRAMAGEYSRELSVKVFKGHRGHVLNGFRQGGPPGYGLRRLLLTSNGEPKALLKKGEHKSIQTERIKLVPGPPEEIAVVRRIYDGFIRTGLTEREIADELNAEHIPAEENAAWTPGRVRQVLTNEKYIGHNVYARSTSTLHSNRVKNPPQLWVRCPNAYAAIVDPADFQKVQEIMIARHRKLTNDELLEKLRALVAQHGRLSGLLIDETEGMPSSAAYAHRFGSLLAAYRAINYDPGHDYDYLAVNRLLREKYPKIVASTIEELVARHGKVTQDRVSGLLTVNGLFTVSIVLARCQRIVKRGVLGVEERGHRWHIRFDESLLPDFTIAIRMDHKNAEPLDYFVLPSLEFRSGALAIRDDFGTFLESFHFENLNEFFNLAELVSVPEAA